MFLSRQHTHHRACRSSQDFFRSSSTVHARPCSSVSLGVHSNLPGAGKKPQSPWSGSTLTSGLKSRGLGRGTLDMERGSRGPEPYRLLTPRFGLLSLVLRLHCGAVVEKWAVARGAEEALPINDVLEGVQAWSIRPGEDRSAIGLAIGRYMACRNVWTRLFNPPQ